MPSERPAQRVTDILENARAAREYTAGLSLEAFIADRKTYDAVERCLERICEASVKLGPLAASLMPNQPWDRFRSLGNRLRHEYDRILNTVIWEIVEVDLAPLEEECVAALERLQSNEPK